MTKITVKDKIWLRKLAKDLDDTHRFGATIHEPEGIRWIQISDEMARQLAERLREIADDD